MRIDFQKARLFLTSALVALGACGDPDVVIFQATDQDVAPADVLVANDAEDLGNGQSDAEGDLGAGSDAVLDGADADSEDSDAFEVDSADVNGSDDATEEVDAGPDTVDASQTDAPDVVPPQDVVDATDDILDVLVPDTAEDALTDAVELDVPDDAATDAGGVTDVELTDAAATDVATPDDVNASDADDAADAEDADSSSDVQIAPACATSDDCGGQTPYCTAAGACVACVFDVQCAAPGATCVSGLCTAPKTCKSDKDCTPKGMVCDFQVGVCRTCLATTDCGMGETCWHNQCVPSLIPCQSSKDCPGSDVCNAGACAPCAKDVDCAASEWCATDVCLADACAAGGTTCTDTNNAKICTANGSAWQVGACPANTACANGTCKPVLCPASAIGCEGNSAWACNDTGTSKFSVPCGDGKVCVDGGCPVQICTPNSATCDGADLLTCNATGTVQTTTACAADSACVNGACQPWVCTPGVDVCLNGAAHACTVSGQFGGVVTDCPSIGQVCFGGKCQSPVCTPGETTCQDVTTAATCAANSVTWNTTPCASGSACFAGTCSPIVCAPGQSTCDGNVQKTCDATGTHIATTTECAGSNAICLNNACVPIICTPGNTQCDGAQLATCNVTGTAWISTVCGSNQICESGACAAIVCATGAVQCANNVLQTCSALGTHFSTTTDCGAQGQFCYQGACIAQVCPPGATQCIGAVYAVCAVDGLSWVNTDCNDGNFCTIDTCNIASGCVKTTNTCDDGNACTTDGCTANACTHASNNFTCDDGNACTTGEACLGGACTVSSAASLVATLAGSGAPGWVDGTGTTASLNAPFGLERGASGAFVFAESAGQRVRIWNANGYVGTVAGTGTAGNKDGPVGLASFSAPQDVAVAPDGAVLVADTGNHRIRRIAGGYVTTLAGNTAGFADGVGTAALFSSPAEVAVTRGGVIYVADGGNNRIRRVAPSGKVTTAAGTGVAGFLDGPAASAQLNNPCALALTYDGTVFFYDCNTGRLRKLTTSGSVVTVAGAGLGYQDGAASSALFGKPFAMTSYGSGVLMTDATANRIRFWDGNASVTTLAGQAANGFLDGTPFAAKFSTPRGIAVGSSGKVVIADSSNHRLRLLTMNNTLCDDGNPCTTDSCNNGACTFSSLADAGPCDDGSACTTSDVCNGTGSCGGVAIACDDGKQCTTDTCAPFDGACDTVNRTGACDDGLACTTADTCSGGACSNANASVSSLAGSNTLGTDNNIGTAARFSWVTGVATDASGNVWAIDSTAHRIRGVTANGVVTTTAGSTVGFVDGTLISARFNTPTRIAFNAAGTAFITDTGNNRIRSVTGDTVATFAGAGTAGYLDGASTSAQFNGPIGIVVDGGGTVYVADRGNFRIRTLAANGTVGTLAGSGASGSLDGAASSAAFVDPRGVCVDSSNGTVYVADGDGYTLRKIAGGQVSTLAGKSGTFGLADGQGAAARFNRLSDCVVDANHDIWVVDAFNFRVRRVTPGGLVTTIAGSTAAPTLAGDPGSQTIVDGTPANAVFMHPNAISNPKPGLFYVADHGAVRKLLIAQPLCDDGQACTADSCDPATGVCLHAALADGTACTTGVPCTVGETCLAATCQGGGAKNCDDSNVCTTDACTIATGVCTHANAAGACTDGNACTTNDTCVSGACDASQSSLTAVAGAVGALTTGTTDGKGSVARFSTPQGVFWDSDSVAWIADTGNHTIRKMLSDGTVTTAAGVAGSSGFIDGAAATAKFATPAEIVGDGAGGLIIADWGNNRIRRLSGGVVSTVAGSGTGGYLDGAPTSAQFYRPNSVDIDSAGVIYVADGSNRRIRTIAKDGTVGTFAGSGTAGGADGAASSASFVTPSCVRVAPSGAVWVVDAGGFTVRRIYQGNVSTVAGLYNTTGTADGTGSMARFTRPWGCSIDQSGNLLVSDSYAFRLRKVTPAGVVTTLVGSGLTAGAGTPQTPADGLGSAGKLAYPLGIDLGPDGNVWISDQHAIRKLVLPQPNCDDGIACTIDACDSTTGACTHVAATDGSGCDDGDACTLSTTCTGGTCSGGTATNCSDNIACTVDACNKFSGCTHATAACCTVDAGTTWGFEGGTLAPVTTNYGWVSTTGAHGGNYEAYLPYTYSTMTANLNLPAKAIPTNGTTTLAFWYDYQYAPYYGYSSGYRTFSVVINGSIVWTAPTSTPLGVWQSKSIDLTPYAGTTPTIALSLGVNAAYSASTYGVDFGVDDVLISTSCP